MRKCKECGKRIYRGKSKIAWYRWVLRLCQYCYRWKFPKRKRSNLPVLRQGSERLLSWSERREMEQVGFNTEVWSEAFCREMEDYWFAIMRGEIRI